MTKKYQHIKSRNSLILLTSVVLPLALTAPANSAAINLDGDDNLVWEVGKGITEGTVTTDSLSEIATSAIASDNLTALGKALEDAIKMP